MALTKTQICNLALSLIGDTRNQLTDVDTDNTTISRQCLLHYEQTLHELIRMHSWNCAKSRVVLYPFPNTITFSDAVDTNVNGDWSYSSTDSNGYKIYTYGSPAYTVEFNNTASQWEIKDDGDVVVYTNSDTDSTTPPDSGWSTGGPDVVYNYPFTTWRYRTQVPSDCIRILALTQDESTNQFFRPNIDWIREGSVLYSQHENPLMIYEKEVDPADMDSLFARAFYTLLAIKLAKPLEGDDQMVINLTNQLESVILPEARRVNGFVGNEPEVVDSEWLDASLVNETVYRPFGQSSYGSLT